MVVGTDIDLLVMLVAQATTSNLYMLCRSKPMTVYCIQELQDVLGDTKQHLLFIHAVTGCNTTSALYNQGKRKALKLFHINKTLDNQMEVFLQGTSSHDEVAVAGEKFSLTLYGGDTFSTLDKYRHGGLQACCCMNFNEWFIPAKQPPSKK